MSWKHSFKRLNEEYELATKKKQALDKLFESGKISKATHESFNSEIVAAIEEIEKQRRDLLSKMQLKMQALESQIKTLEMLLANYEIQHVVGEIDDESYQHEITLLTRGLDAAKQELALIVDATNQLSVSPLSVTERALPKEPVAESVAEASCTGPIPPEVTTTPESCIQETISPTESSVVEPSPVATTEPVPIAVSSADNGEVVSTQAPEGMREISEEPVVTENGTSVVAEQSQILIESVPTETVAEISKDLIGVTETVVVPSQESASPIVDNVNGEQIVEFAEETTVETKATDVIAEIHEKPVTVFESIDDSVITQTQEETEKLLLTEEPYRSEDATQVLEEISHEINPQIAPEEAHQEAVAKTTTEHIGCEGEEAAEGSENQEEAQST